VTPASTRTRLLAVAAAGAALALSGCGQLSPGVAADVAGTDVTVAQVDDLAGALCAVSAAQSQDAGGVTATRQVRTAALNRMIQVELALQLGEQEGVEADAGKVATQLQSVEGQLSGVSATEKQVFLDDYRQVVTGAEILTELGRRSLQAGGTARPDDQAALNEGGALLQDFAAKADVEVDSRFGTFGDGQLGIGSGSLSVPVSEEAKGGSAVQITPAFASGLPASQQCG
jgi:hypothetical protein